ncbi:MAG: GC-type dockerin domain-anchored protein, partial [Planctomycetota bacterium]
VLERAEQDGRVVQRSFRIMLTLDAADLAAPFGVLTASDVNRFVTLFVARRPGADLAEPFGAVHAPDISAFVNAFIAGPNP